MEELIGKQLGQYQILSVFGEGGMATVYQAFQPSMERLVALKVLPRHLARDPQFIGRFRQEAKIVANLQHTHILPVFDFGEEDGFTFFVMPFVESGTLSDQLRAKKPLPLHEIQKYINQLGDALDYAHSQGVIHRDIKPSNVLIDSRGNCLLSDFGVAKIVEGSSQLTQSGSFVGTPAYMSPEQMKGETIDQRSDIYSLGNILYEMATGRQPFRAETPAAVLLKVMQEPLPLPRDINPELPTAVELVILKSLAKRSQERYSSAKEMAAALELAILGEGKFGSKAEFDRLSNQALPTRIYSDETQVDEPSLNRRWWALGGLALIVAILVVASLVLGTPFSADDSTSRIAPSIQVTEAELNAAVDAFTATQTSTVETPLLTEPTLPQDSGVLFFDDFEDGTADEGDWSLGEAWGVVQAEDGNYVLQATNASDWSTAQAGAAEWENYAFEFKARIEQSSESSPQRMDEIRASVRVNWNSSSPGCERYEIILGTTGGGEIGRDGSDCTRSRLLSEAIRLNPQQWYEIRIEVYDSQISVFNDGEHLYSIEDSTPLLKGQISFAAPPDVIVQFDDIRVSELDAPTYSDAVAVSPSRTPTPPVAIDSTEVSPNLELRDILRSFPRDLYSHPFPGGNIYINLQDANIQQQLTFTEEEEYWPSWSPDGRQIVFQRFSASQPFGDLWIMNADGQNERQLTFTTPTHGSLMPVWSPDGAAIVYIERGGIAEIRPDGTRFQWIVEPSKTALNNPTISPNGTQIVFNEILPGWDGPGPFTPTIVVINRDGTNRRVVHIGPSQETTEARYYPVWSPDGTQIGFGEFDGLTYLVPADGQGAPEQTLEDIAPWSPTYWPQWSGQTATPTLVRSEAAIYQALSAAQPHPNGEFAIETLEQILIQPPDFEDDFSDPNSGFGENNEGGGFARYEDGVFVMTAPEDGWSNTWTGTSFLEHADIVVQADVYFTPQENGLLQGGQISLRHGTADYGFEILYDDAKAFTQLGVHDRIESDLVYTTLSARAPLLSFAGAEIGTWHNVIALAKGDQLAYFVDGNLIAAVTDNTVSEGGLLIEANPGSEMQLDNLRVWLLDN